MRKEKRKTGKSKGVAPDFICAHRDRQLHQLPKLEQRSLGLLWQPVLRGELPEMAPKRVH